MVGLAHNHPSGTYRVHNLATGEVVCRQDVSRHPAAAERSEDYKNKDRNGGGNDENVGSGIGAGMFGTVKAQVELQQERNFPQGGNQQLELMEEQ